MAFILKNFAPAGNNSNPITDLTAGALGKGAPAYWTYVTEDSHATVDAAGYFNAGVAYQGVYNQLHICDIIDVVVVAAGALSTYGRHIVKDKASGTVDVTDVTVGTVTDSR